MYCWKKGKEREINGRKKKIFKVGEKKRKKRSLPALVRQKVCRR